MKNLSQYLYKTADSLRNRMTVQDYKYYLLGLFFYKYLSDKLLIKVVEITGESLDTYNTKEKQTNLYEEVLWNNESQNDINFEIIDLLGYAINPELLFNNISKQVKEHTFEMHTLVRALDNLTTYEFFSGLFDDIDLYSNKLGSDLVQRTRLIEELIYLIDKIDLDTPEDDKKIGEVFSELIYHFDSASGKSSFYPPTEISKIMARIVTIGQKNNSSFSVYDPTMGFGSSMLEVKNYIKASDSIKYYGQELNASTFNIAKMNLLVHGINQENIRLRNGDALDKDWPIHEKYLDSVVMIPPFSARWSADPSFLDDSRFMYFGKLAPKSKADYAYLLHGFYHLNEHGTMAIALPQGVLFRGAAEGEIRRRLLENGNIDAVIGLPGNLLSGTSIPLIIIILKKSRLSRDVLFIDHSKELLKEKKQNKLSKNDVEKIISTYIKRENVDKYAHLATYTEISDNGYNLNIPRYVSNFEEEPPVDIKETRLKIKSIKSEKAEIENCLKEIISELELRKDKTELKDILELLKCD